MISVQLYASINKLKSNGLWCGAWKHRQDRHLEICWKNKGLKFLGVYLGNEPAGPDSH